MSESDAQARERLEQLVVRQQQELAAAQQEAASARAAKSAFLARMSHEIRTPLNTIIGQNHILLRDLADPRRQAQIDKVLDAAHQLLTLVDEILDLSRIEAGQVTLAHRNFAVANVLDGIAGRVSAQARDRGLVLRTRIAPDVPRVLCGDPTRLRQLLHHYASNAVKFTERGHVELAVDCAGDSRTGIRLRFAVADTGPGLTAEQRARLFQAFEQVDGGVSRRHGGTGLGLVLCRELATLMGGRVGVDSQPGVGSTFWFEAPFEMGIDDTAIQHDARFASALRAASRRVLLVDDDPISNEVAEYLLRREGFEVDIACDGLEAVERATGVPYIAVLMDIQMPHMDGLEATRAIRRMPDHAATPIIALTANVFEEDRRACYDAGMSDLVAKPVDPAHLSAMLARWVPAASAQATSPTAECPVVPSSSATDAPRQQLLRLQQLVAQDDLEARELFRTLPPEACGPLHADLRRRLDDFDYDQAAVLIAARLQALEQESP